VRGVSAAVAKEFVQPSSPRFDKNRAVVKKIRKGDEYAEKRDRKNATSVRESTGKIERKMKERNEE